MMKTKLTGVIAGLLLAGASLGAAAAEPAGTWLSQSKETQVTFQRSGSGFVGTISWTKSGDQSLVGKRMVYDVRKTGDNRWTGKLWNYQNGKTYNGKLEMLSANRLKLSGCVAGGIICRNQTWTKAN